MLLYVITLLLLLVAPFSLFANELGKVTHLSGVLSATRADGNIKILSVNSVILAGDQLRTEEDTYARIKFNDNAEVVLRPETEFKVNDHRYQETNPNNTNLSDMQLIKGGMRAVTGLIGKNTPEAVKVITPTATIGIRGTHFGLLFCDNNCASVPTVTGKPPVNGLHLDVAQGSISATNNAGVVVLSAGEFGYVRDLATPPVQVPTEQGIQVTMPSNIRQNGTRGEGITQQKNSECIIQ